MRLGESLSNTTTIEQLGAEPGQSISLLVQLTSPPPHSHREAPANQFQPTESLSHSDGEGYHMPDAFTVQIEGEGEQSREVLVKVERAGVKKPFLGGYRHRVTGVEYHHASAQTMPKRRPDNGVSQFTLYICT